MAFQALKGFLAKTISSNPEASYGRLISLMSFVVFNLLYILVTLNPKGIFTNQVYTAKMFDYLFYLVLGGYGLTTGKDILTGIWPFNKLKKEDPPQPAVSAPAADEPDPKP